MTKMAKTKHIRIDTEVLITLVEKHPCIWDIRSEEYKDRVKKEKAFLEIANVVVSDFKTLGPAKKAEAVKIAKQRWKSARDAYRRDRNKQQNPNFKSQQNSKRPYTYVFYDNLRFLDRVLEFNNSPVTKVGEFVDVAETNRLSESDISEEEEDEEEGEEDTYTNSSREETVTHKPLGTKKLKRVFDDDVSSESNYMENDKGDRAFLESLLPILRTFDDIKKLQFRAEVLRIAMELKNIPSLTPTRYQPRPSLPRKRRQPPVEITRFQENTHYDNFQLEEHLDSPTEDIDSTEDVKPGLLILTEAGIEQQHEAD